MQLNIQWHYDMDTVQLTLFHGSFAQVIMQFWSSLKDQVQLFNCKEVQGFMYIMRNGSGLNRAQEHRDREALFSSLEAY